MNLVILVDLVNLGNKRQDVPDNGKLKIKIEFYSQNSQCVGFDFTFLHSSRLYYSCPGALKELDDGERQEGLVIGASHW